MNRYYCHYEEWEDYKAGMYAQIEKCLQDNLGKKVLELFTNSKSTYEAMESVILKWPIATKVNLSNLESNRRAWLGQAACFIVHSVPEYVTREMWGKLPQNIQDQANRIAEIVIEHWEEDYFYNGGLFVRAKIF